mgnify:CR=1 FL=1
MFGLYFSMFLTILLLFSFLFAVVAAVGTYFGASIYFIIGMAVFFIFLQWLIGPSIIRATTNMRELKPDELPWLHKKVKELSKKYRIPMPKILIARIAAPNAFVFGHLPSNANLVVTQGLLNTLNQEEVEAVIGHEMGHIKHKDMVVMVAAAVIPMILYFIALNLMWGGFREERRGVGLAALIGFLSFIGYFIANLLVSFLSRLREYYADRFGAIAVNPRVLATALAKITYGLALMPPSEKINPTAKYFFIADPTSAAGEITHEEKFYRDYLSQGEIREAIAWEKRNRAMHLFEFFRTHPLTYKRIEKLLELEKKR